MHINHSPNTYYFPNRILEAVSKISDYPLSIIEAPMGYGKSLAVKEVLTKSNDTFIWLGIDRDEIGAFWKKFWDSFSPINDTLAFEMAEMGIPKTQEERQKALGLITTKPLESKLLIVIDDYHEIMNEKINKFIKMISLREIENLHIILLMRYCQFANLQELSLKGHLYHLEKTTFELSPLEVKKYFRHHKIILSDADALQLFQSSEGWYLNLYLRMLSYLKSETVGNSTNFYQLIEDSICSTFSEKVSHFLESVSFLETFTLAQAIQISGCQQALEILETLQNHNLFVTYSEVKETYHLHHALAEHFQNKFARREPAYAKAFYTRLANYYFGSGDYVRAMHYCFLVEDFDQLLQVVEKDRGHSVFIVSKEAFIGYFESCPKEVLNNHPIALLIYAICLFSFNEMELFSGTCKDFEALMETCQDGIMDGLRGEYEMLLSFTQYNHIEKMLEHIKRANIYLREPVKFMDTKASWTFNAPSVLYMFHREQGKLALEVEQLKEAMLLYKKWMNGHGSGSEAIMEAEYCFNMGNCEGAEILLNRALYPANRNGQKDIVLCAMFLEARIAICSGNYEGAKYILQKMYNNANTEGQSGLYDTVALCEGFLYANLGQYENVPTWISEGDFDAHRVYFPTQSFYKIVYGRALLINGEYLKLLGISNELIAEASIFPNLLSLVYIYLYVAAANYQIHRLSDAKAFVKQALELIKKDQLYMPFVENGDYLLPLYKSLQEEGTYREDLEQISELYKRYRHSKDQILKKNFLSQVPVLTQREREIALLACKGLTNKEIGERLFISTNTVKMALKNIFIKLDINNRALLKQFFS